MLTLERLHPRVLAHVSGEFIGTGKLPTATLPVALVRFLPGVRPHVGRQVPPPGERLVASGVRAVVDSVVPLRGVCVAVNDDHEVVRRVRGKSVSKASLRKKKERNKMIFISLIKINVSSMHKIVYTPTRERKGT